MQCVVEQSRCNCSMQATWIFQLRYMYRVEPLKFIVCISETSSCNLVNTATDPLLTLSACARVTVVSLSVCLSTLEPAAIRMLQLQSQQCLDATLQCLYCVDFLIKALERRHDLYSYYTRTTTGHFIATPRRVLHSNYRPLSVI